MLRIDPAAQPLWRTVDAVQFGDDPVVAVLDPVPPGGERVLAALVRGTDRAGLDEEAATVGLAGGDVDRLLAAVAPALVTGPEPLADEYRVALEAPPDLAAALVPALGLDAPAADPHLVLLAAHHLVPPAATVRHLREDRPHLAVVFGDQAVTVGPLVLPGRTPCLHCAELHRLDEPGRRAVGAQLLRRTRSRTASALPVRLRAALVVAEVLALLRAGAPTGLEAAATRLAPDGAVSRQPRPWHERCPCRWDRPGRQPPPA